MCPTHAARKRTLAGGTPVSGQHPAGCRSWCADAGRRPVGDGCCRDGRDGRAVYRAPRAPLGNGADALETADRPLTDAEAVVVAPAMTGLCRRGVGPAHRDVLVAIRDWGLTPYGFGRQTVVLPIGLIHAAETGRGDGGAGDRPGRPRVRAATGRDVPAGPGADLEDDPGAAGRVGLRPDRRGREQGSLVPLGGARGWWSVGSPSRRASRRAERRFRPWSPASSR